MDKFEIVAQGNGEYEARVGSLDGATAVTLVLVDAEDVSNGQLADDEQTAHGVFRFLLTHQDASDLPGRLEIGDVLAAYPGAIDGIRAQFE